MVIIRGGGSKADLECFNDYDLAFYITQFPLPVITGIGHERDESVADMVAAKGLKTPTAVAEFLVDQLLSFEFRLSAFRDQITVSVNRTVQQQKILLERAAGQLAHLTRGFIRRETEFLQNVSVMMQKGHQHHVGQEKGPPGPAGNQEWPGQSGKYLQTGLFHDPSQGKAITGIEEIQPGIFLKPGFIEGTVFSKAEKISKQMAKEKISYDDAMKEIEEILGKIEEGDLGVDELAEKVNRVTHLLKICRDRLYKTEEQINNILSESVHSALGAAMQLVSCFTSTDYIWLAKVSSNSFTLMGLAR